VKRLLNDVKALSSEKTRNHAAPVLSDRQYQEVSAHILSCTGLHFEPRNRPALERGLAKRMSALLISSFDEYLLYLKLHGEDRHELQKLLQFLTVGETYFFRYPAQFQALRERLLASYAQCPDPIRIWSAGCSTGEEPYSIAMSIMEALPDWRSRDIKIYASDINNRSIKRARDGVYSPWSMRITQEHHQRRYFNRVGDSYIIRDEVKDLVEFHHLNLSSIDLSPLAKELVELDALFCRNVLIYFSPDAAAELIDSFAGMLKPSGQLFLGHAETLLHRCPQLQVRRQDNSFYYVKAPAGSVPVKPVIPAAIAEKAAAEKATAFEATFPPPVTAPQPGPLPVKVEHTLPAASPEVSVSQAAAHLPSSATASPQSAPSASPVERLQAARLLFEAEEFDAAQKVLDTLAGCPEESEALVLRGFILAGKGLFWEADAVCDRILAQNDLLPEAYFLKGVLLDATDHPREAAEQYRKAILLDHEFIMPRYHMGRVHLRLGRPRDAAREIRNSIRILSKLDDGRTVPFSGGLTRAVCMMQLQNALAQVA
jgi:chemotaxis protein methyltransferase CheR